MNARYRQYERKRTFSAIILLMVMMLQVGVKIIHHHHYAERETVTCSDCEHHRVHDGHILNWNEDNSDCVICQLFSSPFCEVEEVRSCIIPSLPLAHAICSVTTIVGTEQMHIIPRASPSGSL